MKVTDITSNKNIKNKTTTTQSRSTKKPPTGKRLRIHILQDESIKNPILIQIRSKTRKVR